MGAQQQQAKLTGDTVNPRLLEAQYAVRGDIVARSAEIKSDLKAGKGNYPFKSVVNCNIGNPHSLGQKPITFYRQVLALCEYPQLMEHDGIDKLFPADAIKRAKEYLEALAPGGTGAYTDSQGLQLCREQIAESMKERDGVEANPADIFMTSGASGGVMLILQMLVRNKQDCMLVPFPQYPLYSAGVALAGGTVVPYFPNEDKEWAIDPQELERVVKDAKQQGLVPRCLAVITPGNPTGQVIEQDNQEELIKFAKEHDLAIIADEVYQANIYRDAKKFVSFKKTISEMGSNYSHIPMFSLQSISKGYYGECGKRGGYMEVIGLPKEVRAELTKACSINLCPAVQGQICMALVMKPPKEGEPSWELFRKERDGLLESLKRRAKMLEHALNKLEGVHCTPVDGALYAFPTIHLPNGASEKAKELGKSPDWLYCKELLEATGIVVVPGSGFGQADGTLHFRTTILPAEDAIEGVCNSMQDFHGKFLKKYGSS